MNNLINAGKVSIDIELLQNVMSRWQAIHSLSTRVLAEIETYATEQDLDFDTDELSHHCLSDHTAETMREFQDLINDLVEQEDEK